ncbi:MAG: protein-glutamate O-methyltransferase CheR [Candidatus Cloacimonetes bacterium]|jgi:chemotaxis methyl-accepting protein methylase|nr:protein-glutamate O-methyltransferase CheR [Candidatus Cloacimonadota bacterium]MBT4334186.1 protein-glutamate O-methyltransferase CheR [Candidatus Cloacimonadota bacterium]
MKQKINMILNFLHDQRGFDFSGNRLSMLERRITKRLYTTKCDSLEEYYDYIILHPQECDKLIDVLTINVSSFFRNSLTWEYTNKFLLPKLFEKKEANRESSIRFWSAGCASGEEPYSIAILINEFFKKENTKPNTHIFATDIDTEILKKAEKATFDMDAVKNIKLGLLRKYFIERSDLFTLKKEIKDMVSFSFFDLLDRKRYSPPGSVFGNFDIILCRNVLIYFNNEFQERIFDKLYRSLNKGGYLILGEAEVPIQKFKSEFRRIDKCCKIYQKR